MTWREKDVLRFLDDKMSATSHQIGEMISTEEKKNPARVAGTVCARLSKQRLVTYLFDEHAWRITNEGRAALRSAA